VSEFFAELGEADGLFSVLVNNAGILDQRPFVMSTFEAFWRQIEVNFKGVRNFLGNAGRELC